MFKALIRRSTDESEDNRRLVAGKPAIALVMACGQIIAGKGSSTFMQQAPVSLPQLCKVALVLHVPPSKHLKCMLTFLSCGIKHCLPVPRRLLAL